MSSEDVAAIFGPERNASDHAGAVAFSDAQMVLFPIRSLKGGFVYGTSPLALARLRRMIRGNGATWQVPQRVKVGECLIASDDLLTSDKLVLEAFEFTKAGAPSEIAAWLATHCLPSGDEYAYFRKKIEKHLVILSDEDFSHFVENATIVEPHVKINNETGTAEAGGLFYTECLPPEAVLAGHLLMSEERRNTRQRRDESLGDVRKAEVLVDLLSARIFGSPLQLGGDATTGRGLVVLNGVSPSVK